MNTTYFSLDLATFRTMWGKVEEEIGTEWKNESCLKTWDEMDWDLKDTAYVKPNARAI